jgi:hypothetical protein
MKGFGEEIRDKLNAAGCRFVRQGKGDSFQADEAALRLIFLQSQACVQFYQRYASRSRMKWRAGSACQTVPVNESAEPRRVGTDPDGVKFIAVSFSRCAELNADILDDN